MRHQKFGRHCSWKGSVMSSFAHNSQDLVDSSGQPTTSRNDKDFVPGSTGTCVHVSGMSRMSQTLPGHPGSTDTIVQDVPIVPDCPGTQALPGPCVQDVPLVPGCPGTTSTSRSLCPGCPFCPFSPGLSRDNKH